MGKYLGDYYKGDPVVTILTTYDLSGESINASTLGNFRVYKNMSATQLTGGVSASAAFDSLAGMVAVRVNTSAAEYSDGADYDVVMTSATINGVSANAHICSFSLENRTRTKGFIKVRGIASAASAAGLYLASGDVATDDEFNTYVVWIHDGTGQGQMRIVEDTLSTADQIVVHPDWQTTPDNTSKYRILMTPPFDVVTLPTVDGSGRVDVGQIFGNAWTTEGGNNITGFFSNAGASVDFTIGSAETGLDGIHADTSAMDIIMNTSAAETSASPAASASMADKVDYLYRYFRNRRDATDAKIQMYSAAGNIVASASTSDDGTTRNIDRMS